MEWDFRMFASTANDELADAIARALGVHLAASEVARFPDGEITVDLHAPQTESVFRFPVDDLTAVPALHAAVRERLPAGTVVVSPDPGGCGWPATAPSAWTRRWRCSTGAASAAPTPAVIRVAGDVRDGPCLLIDDIVATGGTLAGAVEALLAAPGRSSAIPPCGRST